MSKIQRVKGAVTPRRVGVAFLAALGASAVTGTMVNVVALRNAVRGPEVMATPTPAVMATPRPGKPPVPPKGPKAPVAPKAPRAPKADVRAAYPRQAAMAVAPTPRPYEYENRIRLMDALGTVTLPMHTGRVDRVVGPVTIHVPDGTRQSDHTDVLWNPAGNTGGTTTCVWVAAASDVDGVHIWGHDETPSTKLRPAGYFAQQFLLPLHFENTTGRAAVVTLWAGLNYAASPTATPTLTPWPTPTPTPEPTDPPIDF